MAFPAEIRSYHPVEARDAFMSALGEAGFGDAVVAFAQEHPPAAFRFAEAVSRSIEYGDHVRRLAWSWGLEAPWFLEVIHDLAWAYAGGEPTRHYLHPLPSAFGRLELVLGIRPHGSGPRENLSGVALWLTESGASVRTRLLDDAASSHRSMVERWGDTADRVTASPSLRFTSFDGSHPAEVASNVALHADTAPLAIRRTLSAMFDELWVSHIQPARVARGATPRQRGLDRAQRDARATVAHGRARSCRRDEEDLISATMRIMAERWPGSVDGFEGDAVQKAIVKFSRRLWEPIPDTSDA